MTILKNVSLFSTLTVYQNVQWNFCVKVICSILVLRGEEIYALFRLHGTG
jgi:hypothetical protein